MFLLTATPINNRLADFRHMAELFTRRDESYFARTLGINNLRLHFNAMERSLQNTVGHQITDATEFLFEIEDLLGSDQFFRQLVVQRSRAYVRESQMREKGSAVA